MIECKFEQGHTTTNLRHVTMDAIIEEDNKLLMVKRADSLDIEPGKWALPGGYLDKEETTQEGILREVKEETGYEGKVIKLFKIIDTSNRLGDKNRQNVTFVYRVKVTKQVQKPDKESSEIGWIEFKKLSKWKDTIAFDHWQLSIEPFIKSKSNKDKPSLFN